MKVHKRYQKNVAVGETVRCGLMYANLDDKQMTWLWKEVTCKNCLRLKKRKIEGSPGYKRFEDRITTNFIGKVRHLFIRLLAGKDSIVGNCTLINVDAIVNGKSFIYNCKFAQGKGNKAKNYPNRIPGITLRPKEK